MRIVMFYHSLVSDWNHGNAHFLRGVVSELLDRGHDVEVYEPSDSWSRTNLLKDHGTEPLAEFRRHYSELNSYIYESSTLELADVLRDADLVIVHEWNDPALVKSIGRHHARHDSYCLLFHDTHHRAASRPEEMAAYDLSSYDGVLAFGKAICDRYLAYGWTDRVWVWHEAADVKRFYARRNGEPRGELVWIGNWGDDERAAELEEYLIRPVRELGLRAAVYGVRYPSAALERLANAGIEYRGWLPNWEVPRVFGEFRVTVHVPRRPYVKQLPGIPTIRMFEALACGIPLVSAYWNDSESLFTARKDYLVAHSGRQMCKELERLLGDSKRAAELAENGYRTVRARHTCANRVDELLEIVQHPSLVLN